MSPNFFITLNRLLLRTSPIWILVVILLISINSRAQVMHLEILGGATVTDGSTVTINAGTTLDFRITNVETANCDKLKVQGIDISNTSDFDISPNNPNKNIKPLDCPGNNNFLDFEIENISSVCNATSTLVTIEIKNQSDFTFTLVVNTSPIISVLGGAPIADVVNGSATATADNGTFFGVVEPGDEVVRSFCITNTGTCPLDITSITSSLGDYSITTPVGAIPPSTYSIDPETSFCFDITFIAPALTGNIDATITIENSSSNAGNFTYLVSAEIFNFNIPGPGGITADFRLWLKTNRGITETGSKVSYWQDLGTNGKSAEQPVAVNQPTYLDDAASNINFNPVIKFENDGSTVEQYLYNTTNGFYSQDVFIVMIPDANMANTSSRNTIFGGVSSGGPGDITGIGFGDYSSRFTNEVLSFNQDTESNYNGEGEISTTKSYSNAGIINIRNDASPVAKQEILYNSKLLTTSSVDDIAYDNVGYVDGSGTIMGSEYWIGRNFDVQGSLNGRVAEIFTFAERVADSDRQKIESYLAIKYGITLGASNEAEKDYINSFGSKVWDIAANAGYNYNVAGIGRDSISDLNQKQSKTLNTLNDVTIGLGGVFSVNSDNPNEFKKDGDFLVWGSNNDAYTGTNTNTITLATGLTSTVTRIDRQWKIVQSIEDVDGDVENVYISIPEDAFSAFTKSANEEYVLIVADNDNFADGDIIDVIPLRPDGSSNLQTWYHFDGVMYFTFGKVQQILVNQSVSVQSGEYLVGEYYMNLNADSFTVSAWIKSSPSANTRTIMSKGNKLQIRLNASNNVEVIMDDVTPKLTSTMVVNDSKWHHITAVYKSGSIILYIDGVLDKSEHDIVAPSPNFNRFCVGAIYVDEHDVINPFLGEIDEVYVWNDALTESQLRYLMNQEIERFDVSGTDYVSGKVLPYGSSSNEIAGIQWNELEAYYDFNSFYGTTVEGLSDSRHFLRLNYTMKDKSIIDEQTAPLPYRSIANGEWDDTAIWENSSDQVMPNTIGLDGTTSIDWNIVETTHNISSGDRDIVLLGLKNNSGIITIADPFETLDEINSGQGLTVTNYLEIDGVIDLVGESQLVQTEGSVLDEDSGGYIERDQQGTANSYNYNYWSSSVGPISGDAATRGTGISSLNANHSISDVLFDGTTSNAYLNISFNTSHSAADSGTSSPIVISSYWLYKFYGANDNYNSWQSINEISSLIPGEGYTMKGSSGAADILNDFQNYVFKGKPNNGDITLALDKSAGEVQRLIGNPYPSAIDAEEFILDNLSVADGGSNVTGNIINGALYFWDHFGEENTHILSGYVGGYATRNLTGGVAAISNDSRINNTSNAGSPDIGTKVPGQYIPVNQGFFVSTAIDGFNNDNDVAIATVDGGNILFKNNQRVFVTETTTSSVFLRVSSDDLESDNMSNNEIKKIRLVYESPGGYYRQILIGKNPNASNEFDLGYDAFIVDINPEDMYWTIDGGKFVIQGVNSFDLNQEFSMGLIVNESGLARIKIDMLENINTDTPIYIKDTVTNQIHPINTEPFEIYLEPGTYEDRFKLVFTAQTLSMEDLEEEDEFAIYYDSQLSQLVIDSDLFSNLLNAELYNTLGQKIQSLDITSPNISLPKNIETGVYVVVINTMQGSLSKKILIK